MPDKERERDLTGRCLMSLGNIGQDPAALGFGARKIVMAEGAVSRYRHAVTDTPGKHRMFNSPFFEVIKNLVAGHLFASLSRDAVSLIEIISVEVADTPGKDFLITRLRQPGFPVRTKQEHTDLQRGLRWRATRFNSRKA